MACLELIWSRRTCIGIFGYWRSSCLIFTIFSFLSDGLCSGNWLEADLLTDSSLSELIPGLFDLQLDAKAPSTVLEYKSGWLRWRKWALSKIGVSVIPGKPLHIALFISELAKRSSKDNTPRPVYLL